LFDEVHRYELPRLERDWELFEHSVRFVPSQFVLGAGVTRVHIVCNELLKIRLVEILAD